jgi:hypothetical protein
MLAARALRVTSSVLLLCFAVVILVAVTTGMNAESPDDIAIGDVVGTVVGIGGGIVIIVLAIVSARAANRLRRTANMHLAASAPEAMAEDVRPPVLYLRSFSDEPHTQRIHLGRHWDHAFMEEEFLLGAVAKLGPFVAVGHPGDHLPQLGAHRLYVRDAEWTSVVLRLMGEAAAVVIRIGPGEGVAWETRQAVVGLPPERLAFLIPRDVSAYNLFKAQVDPLLPRASLPWYPSLPARRAFPAGFELLGCLHFTDDWSPRLEQFDFRDTTPSRKKVEREFSRCLSPFVLGLQRERR